MNSDQTPAQEERWPDIRARSRTFYDAPLLGDLDALDAKVAFVGMPFDQGTFGRPGARYGPDAVRDARGYSYIGYGGMQFDQEAAGYFDSDRERSCSRASRWQIAATSPSSRLTCSTTSRS